MPIYVTDAASLLSVSSELRIVVDIITERLKQPVAL